MNRLSIYHIAGHVRLTHRDRIAICAGFWRYLRYLVFELRTEVPKATKDEVAQILIGVDFNLVLRITFKEEEELKNSDLKFDYKQMRLHMPYLLKF